MDKTSRLIKWQRITIVVLLMAVISMGVYAGNAVSEARAGRAARKTLREFSRIHTNDKQMLRQYDEERQGRNAAFNDLKFQRESEIQIIRDLDERLSKYEKRYGEISPVRKGEGDCLNGPSSVLVWHRLPSR